MLNLKHRNLKKPEFCTLFLKKAIFRKLANNWTQKKNTQNDNWTPKNRLKPLLSQCEINMAQLVTINLAQLVTIKKAKLGPGNNFTAYIYIYICCEVIIWAKFGHFRCYYLG